MYSSLNCRRKENNFLYFAAPFSNEIGKTPNLLKKRDQSRSNVSLTLKPTCTLSLSRIILGESLLEAKVPQILFFLQKSSAFTLEGGSSKLHCEREKNCLSPLNELNYLGTAQDLSKHFNRFRHAELIFLQLSCINFPILCTGIANYPGRIKA